MPLFPIKRSRSQQNELLFRTQKWIQALEDVGQQLILQDPEATP